MNRLGLFTGSGLVGAAIVPLLIVVTAFATGGEIFSAGPLNADQGPESIGGAWSHADLACSDCHTPFWSPTRMGDRCLECHTDIAEQLAAPNSLHAGIASPESCRKCHPEHRGSHGPLTLYAPDLYPHAEFGFFLISHLSHADGQPFTCDDCHTDPPRPFSQDTCIDCHEGLDSTRMAAHELDFGSNCLACHDGIDTFDKSFDHHAAAFPLEGLHVDLACSTCHAGASDLIALRAAPTECVSCHAADDAHQGSLGTDCAGCHTPQGWETAKLDHALTAFPLAGRHVDLACEKCHVGGQLSGIPTKCFECHRSDDPHAGKLGSDCETCHTPEDWSKIIDGNFDHSRTGFSLTGAHARVATCAGCHRGGRFAGTPTDCIGCHAADDAHDGDFGSSCSACHNVSAWTPANFDHAQTGFRLQGSHAGVDCAGCHAGERFKGTPTNCVACHASDDVHKGAFGTDCGACHNPSKWSDAAVDHSRTAFPLTGSHTSAACATCHVNGKFRGTPKTCVACHASDDAHAGGFGTQCGSCHDTSAWRNATVDHNRTAFPLTGRHQGITCGLCHANGVYKGTPKTCIACHASDDRHNGAFGTDCASCHLTSGWPGATFNHGTTAFPLTGRHTSATCAQCHANGVYRGTPKACVACHASDDAHNGAFGTNCASCHTTSGWAGATFNHGSTAFPLTGRHTSATCTQCHVDGVYQGTPKACIACHASDDAHGGQFGTSCSSCHTPSGWGGATFNHANTAFPLTGRHTSAACTQCHVNGVYLGTPKACVACHASDDAHGGQFGTNCGSCHTTSGWGGATFNHGNTAFALTGQHTGAACTQCHVGGVYQGTPTSCAACHNAPSSHPGFYGSDCRMCHNTSDWSVRYGGGHTFPLNHKGAGNVCTACHTGSFSGYTCYNCHDQGRTQDQHENAGDLSDCAACHPTGKH